MRIFRFFFIGTLIFLIIFAYSQFIGPGGPKEKERFIIKPDTLQTEVINNLYSQKFLKNKTIFNWILTRRRKSILPGAYLISKSMNAYQLAVALTSFPYQKWVTIPSGIRKEQAALIVSQVLDWSPNKAIEFIKIAQEGWLYPDTYLINTDYDAKQTFQKLFSTFNEKLPPNLQKTLLSQNIRLDTAIKFASLIEREYGSEEDRKIIAGIIWNYQFSLQHLFKQRLAARSDLYPFNSFHPCCCRTHRFRRLLLPALFRQTNPHRPYLSRTSEEYSQVS